MKKQTTESQSQDESGDGSGAPGMSLGVALLALLLLVGGIVLATGRFSALTAGAPNSTPSVGRAAGSEVRHVAYDDVATVANIQPRRDRGTEPVESNDDWEALRVNLPPADEAGLIKIELEPAGDAQWWEKNQGPKIDFFIDDEEWDSYELPAHHPDQERTVSCAKCHAPGRKKSL